MFSTTTNRKRTRTLNQSIAMIDPLESRVLFSACPAATSASALIAPSSSIVATATPAAQLQPAALAPVATVASLALVVSRTSLPAALVGGGAVHGTGFVNITNSGLVAVSGSFTIQIVASLDGIVDPSDGLVGTISKKVHIGAGGTATTSVPIRSLPANLNGTYTLLAEITDTAGGIKTATTGPTIVVAAAFVSYNGSAITTNLPASAVSGGKTTAKATLTVVNNGNVPSSGLTSIILYAFPEGSVSGTPIRTLSAKIILKPGKSQKITIPLQSLPAVVDGNYFIVANLTAQSGNASVIETPTTVALAAPFVTLVPTFGAIALAGRGAATVTLNVTNNGNSTSTGTSHITFFASPTSAIDGAVQLLTQPAAIILKSGKSKAIRFHLTAAMVLAANQTNGLVAEVVDGQGNTQLAFTAFSL